MPPTLVSTTGAPAPPRQVITVADLALLTGAVADIAVGTPRRIAAPAAVTGPRVGRPACG